MINLVHSYKHEFNKSAKSRLSAVLPANRASTQCSLGGVHTYATQSLFGSSVFLIIFLFIPFT